MIPLPILVGAAIIDSINPCAFGVLIFLLSYLTESSKSKAKLILHGIIYITAVYVTYFSAGLILLPVIGSLGKFSLFFYGVIGILVILSGLAEIKDFFWYGKGFSLSLIPGTSERIKMYANKISDNIISAFILGIFVALVELPCTGAVYLAILSIMSLVGVTFENVAELVLYNFIFVAPLILILLTFVYGIRSEKLEAWRKKHRGTARLIIGIVLVALGVWMLITALPFNIFSGLSNG